MTCLPANAGNSNVGPQKFTSWRCFGGAEAPRAGGRPLELSEKPGCDRDLKDRDRGAQEQAEALPHADDGTHGVGWSRGAQGLFHKIGTTGEPFVNGL
jgi:hypothetical protein